MKTSNLNEQDFAYRNNQRFFAQIADGLEEEGAEELTALGSKDHETVFRGIHFPGNRR